MSKILPKNATLLGLALLYFLSIVLVINSLISKAQASFLKISPTIPNRLGVGIHFTNPKPGEIEMLANIGIRWIRQDIYWQQTEIKKGEYDFSAYDDLLIKLGKHKILAIFILDYNHPFYDRGLSPYTDIGRKAFSDWAVAAVKHFKDRGILWEIYNEPNAGFWKPQPNVNDYIKLALTVGEAIHKTNPNEIFIGPATLEIALPFLEACFKAGLLKYWAAVTVHPYRGTNPETATSELQELRKLIHRYSPQNKQISIISGEWGYPSIPYRDYKLDETIQGKYLARMWLSNLENGVTLSIWYDWQDDGVEPINPEHHFGLVHNTYRKNQRLVYEPKASYFSAKTLANILNGFQFEQKISIGKSKDHMLLFRNTKTRGIRFSVWTESNNEHKVKLPIYFGDFKVVNYVGQEQPSLSANYDGLSVTITNSPKYLIYKKS
jgi:polysaccharide biosynthesis protein PslG